MAVSIRVMATALVLYVLMLCCCFLTALVMVVFIMVSEAWSEPYAIVGNVIGCSTIIFSLMKYFKAACCPNIAFSCRLEFAFAGVASILWFSAASMALDSESRYSCATDYTHPCLLAEVVAVLGFVNGSLFFIYCILLWILISRQTKHGNKDVWTSPLTIAILQVRVSGPSHAPESLEIPYRRDTRADGHDPQVADPRPGDGV